MNWEIGAVIIASISLLISLFSYYLAYKAYVFSASPSLIFKDVNFIGGQGIKAQLLNIGNGFCSKTFIIIETTSREVFLSKPKMDIKPGGMVDIELIWVEKLEKKEYKNIFLYTMDANGNRYSYKYEDRTENNHLVKLGNRMKSANWIGICSPFNRLHKERLISKAIKEENTYRDKHNDTNEIPDLLDEINKGLRKSSK
ncbi:hypothetical protein HB955_03370 [Listeria welshimeri]|nr:hypothetical protein [Listeria welshimeri]